MDFSRKYINSHGTQANAEQVTLICGEQVTLWVARDKHDDLVDVVMYDCDLDTYEFFPAE